MTVEIPLTRGMVALIDDEDLPLVAGKKWTAMKGHKTWYAVHWRRIDGKVTYVSMHRVIDGRSKEEVPNLDHRDGDGLNNRKKNLRAATQEQNFGNVCIRAHSTTGFKGVRRSGNGFSATFRSKHLAQFRNAEDAARAYDATARAHYGAFACVNFPLPGERSALTGEIMPLQVAA